MLASRNLKAYAAAAAALAILLLAAGMLFAIEGLDRVAAAQIAHIRTQQQDNTFAERLRWSGELIVSAGRGYLISGDPALLRRLLQAREEFESGLEVLASHMTEGGSEQLLRDVEADARAFVAAQDSLVGDRTYMSDDRGMPQRFERELIPKQRSFGRSLDRLIERNESILNTVYARGEQERRRLRAQLYGFLGAALLLALTATVHFARRLGNAFEAEHHAVEAARRAVVSRDDLMGVVAHDLRTPLHAIGLRALLIKKIATLHTVQEQAQSIATIVRTMENLIQTMLDVASIQAGRFSVTPALCDVHQIVRDCAVTLEPVASSEGVRLRYQTAPCELTMIADRERVVQVLVNLVGNAIKFSNAGTEVCLQVEPCAEGIAFVVVDQGPGIPPVNLPNVFDRFWKREPDAKTGSGLGLFIARNIVVAHGGRIWAESDGARGTTFRFILPRVSAGASRELPSLDDHQVASAR